MIQKIKDWWYYNVDGYDTDLEIINAVLNDVHRKIEFKDAIELQKVFPRIIKEVTEVNGKVNIKLVTK
jgi:hypothetical protein